MMAKMETISAEITDVQHAATSRNGNPTYRVTFTDGGTRLTETDGSIGYGVTNYRPRHPAKSVSVVLTIGARGRIVNVTRRDGTDA